METSVIRGPIRILLNKYQVMLMLALILLALFSGNLTRASRSIFKSNVGAEEIFKFKTAIVKKALLESGFSVHFLKKGETIYRLSRNYYVSVSSLMNLNRITNPHMISTGEKLYIPPVDYQSGRLKKYQVKSGDTLEVILTNYGLELWQFKRLNPGLETLVLEEGTKIILPFGHVKNISYSTNFINITRPVRGRLTSRFGKRWGRMHYGIDLAAPVGTPVRAGASGRVTFTGWNGGYGWFIKLDHGKFRTNYGHLSRILIRKGASVQKGDLIGLVGATGRAYGSHLHFELEVWGKKVDPYRYMSQY